MNRLIVAMLALTLPGSALAAKHIIQGQVLDRNGEPVDRAIITLTPVESDDTAELVTDREGRFLIDYLRDADGERVKLAKRAEYDLEVFKPGFHVQTSTFFYKRGTLDLEPLLLIEETIAIEDDQQNLAGEFEDRTHSAGATYEGQ